MIELYSLTSSARVIMAMLCFAAMLAQTLVVIFSAQRKTNDHVRLLYETSLVLYFFASAFICGQVQGVIGDWVYIYSVDYFRYVAALSAVFAVILFIKRPGFRIGAAIPLLLITLPIFDVWLSNAYPVIFMVVNLMFFAASLEKLVLSWRAIRYGLSALSVKEALDLIPDGLLFANKKGRIILKNNTIESILGLCRINPLLSVHRIYAEMEAIGTAEYCKCVKVGDSLLLRLLNSGTYLVTLLPMQYKGRGYFQLFAADITEEDILTKELDDYALQLSDTQSAIMQALDNIEEIERTKEMLRLKSNIHDIIGQRLSIVHRFIEDMEENHVSADKLKELFCNLENDLHIAFDAVPSVTFDEIQKLFSIVGVSVDMKGDLPSDSQPRNILLQIIREAATNAVRHGNARHIAVTAEWSDGVFNMSISNDGTTPDKEIVPGNGLKGMREKLSKLGGELSYTASAAFCLQIKIPESSVFKNL